jgi:hypothetical protein
LTPHDGFNSQATPVTYNLLTRRLVLLTVGVSVILTSTFYQTYLLRALMLTSGNQALPFEDIVCKIERRQMSVMFDEPEAVYLNEMNSSVDVIEHLRTSSYVFINDHDDITIYWGCRKLK